MYPAIPFLSDSVSVFGSNPKVVVLLTPFLVAALVFGLTMLINHT